MLIPTTSWVTCCWLCFHTERHQLSLVRWQWHRVHALGLNWWRGRHRDRRLCVHGRQRRLAKIRLWHHVTRSPLWRSPSKSVLLQRHFEKPLESPQMCVWKCPPFSACLPLWLTGSKPFISFEVVCPPTWVKFGQSCYNFEPVVYKLTFEESREHCKLKGRDPKGGCDFVPPVV